MSQELLNRFRVSASEVPIVICQGTTVLKSPTTQELANCLGFNTAIDDSQVRDVVIVGAGPAGLAAAVYASIGRPLYLADRDACSGRPGRIQLEN